MKEDKIFIVFVGTDWHFVWESEFKHSDVLGGPYTKKERDTIYDMEIGQTFNKGDDILIVRIIG